MGTPPPAKQKSNKPRKTIAKIKPIPNKHGMSRPVYVKDLVVEPEPFQPYGISIANTWDPYDVSRWAAANGFCQTAGSALIQKLDGRQLLKTDALKLQRFGVQDGHEALKAEEKISRLIWAFDDDIPDTKRLPVSLHRVLHRDEIPCPSMSPLSMLSTDPWIDNSLKVIDKRRPARQQWSECDHNSQLPCEEFSLYN